MSRVSSILLSVALIVMSIGAMAPIRAATVVVLGDSLSDAYGMQREAGWVARLDKQLAPEHRVVDGSISGDTSAGARTRLDGLLEAHRPDVLLVIIGGNDGLRGLPPDRLEANLDAIVDRGQQAGVEVVLMQVRLPPNLGRRYVEAFEAVYPAIADRHGIERIPFFVEALVGQPGMLMDDGIHPTAAAQAELAGQVQDSILAAIQRADGS